jgi:hypothetical protein
LIILRIVDCYKEQQRHAKAGVRHYNKREPKRRVLMNYEQKVLLFHCLEWLCFWWENQEENHNFPDWKNDEWAMEFAGRFWRCEGESGAAEVDTVPYSAGVFCEDITDVEISERFSDEKELDDIIAKDKEFFTKVSGQSYEEFMPYWW